MTNQKLFKTIKLQLLLMGILLKFN